MSDTVDDRTELVALVAAAYFSNANVKIADVPGVIRQIADGFASVDKAGAVEDSTVGAQRATPAQIRKSITPDALISFEDGKRYKSLRRHITGKGLTVEAYKEKWGLPKDYPLVSPNYSAARSAMAKSFGLGVGGRGKPRTKKVRA